MDNLLFCIETTRQMSLHKATEVYLNIFEYPFNSKVNMKCICNLFYFHNMEYFQVKQNKSYFDERLQTCFTFNWWIMHYETRSMY